MPETRSAPRYATHDDFSAFKKEVREDFEGLRHDFKALSNELTHQFSKLGRTDWSVVLSGVAVLLTIASLAGALVYFMISTESKIRSDSVATLMDHADGFLRNEFEPVEARTIANLTQTAVLTDKFARMEDLREKVDQSAVAISAISERLSSARELIAKNSAAVENIDEILQREMRLLDEVLQREMNLHVDRLDALIQANDAQSKSRNESQQLLIDRNTARRADESGDP